jgi:hypothetical protein
MAFLKSKAGVMPSHKAEIIVKSIDGKTKIMDPLEMFSYDDKGTQLVVDTSSTFRDRLKKESLRTKLSSDLLSSFNIVSALGVDYVIDPITPIVQERAYSNVINCFTSGEPGKGFYQAMHLVITLLPSSDLSKDVPAMKFLFDKAHLSANGESKFSWPFSTSQDSFLDEVDAGSSKFADEPFTPLPKTPAGMALVVAKFPIPISKTSWTTAWNDVKRLLRADNISKQNKTEDEMVNLIFARHIVAMYSITMLRLIVKEPGSVQENIMNYFRLNVGKLCSLPLEFAGKLFPCAQSFTNIKSQMTAAKEITVRLSHIVVTLSQAKEYYINQFTELFEPGEMDFNSRLDQAVFCHVEYFGLHLAHTLQSFRRHCPPQYWDTFDDMFLLGNHGKELHDLYDAIEKLTRSHPFKGIRSMGSKLKEHGKVNPAYFFHLKNPETRDLYHDDYQRYSDFCTWKIARLIFVNSMQPLTKVNSGILPMIYMLIEKIYNNDSMVEFSKFFEEKMPYMDESCMFLRSFFTVVHQQGSTISVDKSKMEKYMSSDLTPESKQILIDAMKQETTQSIPMHEYLKNPALFTARKRALAGQVEYNNYGSMGHRQTGNMLPSYNQKTVSDRMQKMADKGLSTSEEFRRELGSDFINTLNAIVVNTTYGNEADLLSMLKTIYTSDEQVSINMSMSKVFNLISELQSEDQKLLLSTFLNNGEVGRELLTKFHKYQERINIHHTNRQMWRDVINEKHNEIFVVSGNNNNIVNNEGGTTINPTPKGDDKEFDENNF